VIAVDLAGQRLHLLPQRAAYLPAWRTLLVADAHIGKAVSFRRLGVPVPEATTDGTLARLTAAVAATGAERVVFLGDLLHSARAHADDHAGGGGNAGGSRPRAAGPGAGARQPRPSGRRPARQLARAGGGRALRLLGRWRWCTTRSPCPAPTCWPATCTPALVLGGRAHDRLRLPCFHFGPSVGVLPAFGEFTGMHRVQRGPATASSWSRARPCMPCPATAA
jgi:hypothetical protein